MPSVYIEDWRFTFVELTVEYFQLSFGWFHLVVYTTANVNIALTIFLTDKIANALKCLKEISQYYMHLRYWIIIQL